MATYVGPVVAPVYVTGMINTAWTSAQTLTNQARNAVAGLNPPVLTPESVSPLVAPETDFNVTAGSLGGMASIDPQADALENELTRLLRDFIDRHYPPLQTPDGAAAWERIVRTFDGDRARQLRDRMRYRTVRAMANRGITLPRQVVEYMDRDFTVEEKRIEVGTERNQDIIRKTHRKDIDLTQYEIILRTQLDALEAAKAFLLGCVLAALSKTSSEQTQLARMRGQMQSAYFRYLDAQIEAGTVDVEKELLEKQITLDADLSGEERKQFLWRQKVAVALDECQSIASQATAAINRISAQASVNGQEITP